MKNSMTLLLSLALFLSLLNGCGTPDAEGILSGAISLSGSTSMELVMGMLGEQFMMDNRRVSVTYDATGSGAGIEAARTGSADFGLSSRALKEEETAAGLDGNHRGSGRHCRHRSCGQPRFKPDAGANSGDFYGTITNWDQVGGSGGMISCVGREAGGGTRDGFESATGTRGACKLDQELTSTGAVMEAVAGNPHAIGYASLSSVEGKVGVKAITVNGIACSEAAILDGSYPIQRPFSLVTKTGAVLSDQARAFFDFATSPAAHDLIRLAGAVPAT